MDPTGHQGPHLDAIGWRIEFSLGFILGGDINVDLLLNIREMKVELGPEGPKVSGCKFNASMSPGAQVLTFGGGPSTGPLFVFNLPENERLEGVGWRAGGTIFEGAGMEGEVFGSFPEEHEGGTPVGIYIGFGGGEETSAYLGGSYTFDITEWLFERWKELKGAE